MDIPLHEGQRPARLLPDDADLDFIDVLFPPTAASPRAASVFSLQYRPISKAHTICGSQAEMVCILLYTGELPNCRGIEAE